MKKTIKLLCVGTSAFVMFGCGEKPVNYYDIKFCDDVNNVLETVKVKEGEMPQYSKGTPTKEEEGKIYTFDKWLPEIKAATENATYVASFKSETKKYTVTFDSDGGTEIAPITVEWGKRISGINNPTKADSKTLVYTFEYWYDITGEDSVPFNMSTEIKRDYNLKAKWKEEVKSFLVTFDSNGGSAVERQSIEAGGLVEEPEDPTHDDSVSKRFSFNGWYLNDEKFNFSTQIYSDTILKAKWDETLKQYTVTFKSDDEVFDTKVVDYGSTVTAPEGTPTKESDDLGAYTFNSWDYDFNDPIVGDTTIDAKFDITYNYYHYTSVNSTCKKYGCKEFYETKDYSSCSLEAPTEYNQIIEAGSATDEIIDRILENDVNDKRLIARAHEFDDVTGKCIYECGTQSITSSAIDISKLSRTDLYTCPLEYGNMYKYDGYAKDIFTSFSLDGLTQIRFYLANPDSGNTFILNGDNNNCCGGVYGGSDTFDGIIATKTENNWVVTRSSGKTFFKIVGGSFQAGESSYTIENPTKINEIFDTFTYSKVMYLSDIIIEGVSSEQKEILKDAYYTGSVDNKTYKLTDTGEKISGFGHKYIYECLYGTTTTETAFRELFNDISISSFKTISFYIDIKKDNYLTFADDDGLDTTASQAYGLHGKDGAHVPGIIKAFNEGDGTWRITSIGFSFRKVSDGSKTTEFVYHNRTTLKSLFKIGSSNSWQKAAMEVSDVIILK